MLQEKVVVVEDVESQSNFIQNVGMIHIMYRRKIGTEPI
jgi:hypothetical protein